MLNSLRINATKTNIQDQINSHLSLNKRKQDMDYETVRTKQTADK